MLSLLRSIFTTECVVELRSDRLHVCDLLTATEFEFAPILSIDGEQRVVSIGSPPDARATKTYQPFASAAALHADPHIAQLILQYAYSRLGRWSWLKFSPRVLLHVPKDGPGALAAVSDATLQDLSRRAGALRTVVYRGARLSSHEAASRLHGEDNTN
jgi:hypothetical protein